MTEKYQKIKKYGYLLEQIMNLEKMLKPDDESPINAGYILMMAAIKYQLGELQIGNPTEYQNLLDPEELYIYLKKYEHFYRNKLLKWELY